MLRNRKNYFDEIKKRKITGGFFEHIFRLLFFAILLTIEGIFKKMNELRFRLGNFIAGRDFSKTFIRYSEYKTSIQHLLEKPFYKKEVRMHLVEIKDRLFTDRDKTLVFGFRESTQNMVIKSKSALGRFRAHTLNLGKKYFKPVPVFNMTKNYSASFFTFFFKKGAKADILLKDIKQNKEYLKNVTDGYKKFMDYTFNKFYSNDFKSKISAHHAIQTKTFDNNVEKLLKSIKKLEKKQLKSAIEQSIR